METNLTNERSSLAKKLALKFGLIWAAINIIVLLLFYYASPQLLGTWMQSAAQVIIGLGLAIYFTIEIRKQIGGFWTFREAISSIFVLFIVPSIVVYFFTMAFGKWIEPAYMDTIKEVTLNTTTEMLEKFTSDQDLIDKTISETELALDKQFNPGFFDIIKTVGFSVLFYFIASLIWAAIFKRDRPVFLSHSETEEV